MREGFAWRNGEFLKGCCRYTGPKVGMSLVYLQNAQKPTEKKRKWQKKWSRKEAGRPLWVLQAI